MAYADTAVPLLLEKVCGLGAQKRRLIVKVIGGARVLKAEAQGMDIGRRNYQAVRRALAECGLVVHSENVGGTHSRTAMLEIDTGAVTIRSAGRLVRI